MKGNLFAIALLASVSSLSLATAEPLTAPAAASSDPQNADSEKLPLDFAADSLTFDREKNVVIAAGNVFLQRADRVVHAERVIYDMDDGTIAVEGNVWARDKDGNIITARHLVINDDFKSGVIEHVGLILKGDSRFAAEKGRLEGGKKTVLKHAVYSPCTVCDSAGNGITPVWAIRAVEVVHDREKKRVTFKNASMNAFGVPIFWTPYLSHPDPGVHAASGLLMPDIGHSSELGFVGKLPFYIKIAADKDATITPWITSKESLVMSGEYRQNLGFGGYSATGSVTYVEKRDDTGATTGNREFRGHLFSDGQFNIKSLDRLGGDWSWRYNAGWASDDTYLRRYSISDIDTIQSEVALERFGERSYGGLTAMGFQGLRVEDVSGLTPFVLPMAEYHYVSKPGQMGGLYRFDASGLAITRFDGMDTRRLSAGGSWEIPYVGASGSIYTLAASLRGDLYNVSDGRFSDGAAYAGEDGTTARVLPQLRLEWRLPIVKEGINNRQTIEPIVALVGALAAGNPDTIPNEDSRIIGFDDTNLFSSNRFMGLDRWESGSRIDYGLRYGIDSRKLAARFLVGQSYRFANDHDIPDGSGLEGHWSDIIGRAEVSYGSLVNLIYRIRLDNKSMSVRRNEVDAIVGPKQFKLTLGYLDLPTGADDFDGTTALRGREEVRVGAIYHFARYWSMSGNLTRDLDRKASIRGRAGVVYEDECLRFGVFYDKRYTRDRDIQPESTIVLKIALKNFG